MDWGVVGKVYDQVVETTTPVLDRAPDFSNDYCEYDGEGQWWTADPKGSSRIVLAKSGIGSEEGLPPMTVAELFLKAVELSGDKVALRTENATPIGPDDDIPGPTALRKWKSWTFQQYYEDCKSIAKGMLTLGMEPHDSVNILGFNSPEWFIANMSAILAGGKAAGVYPTDNAEQIQFKVDHSNGAVAFVETAEGLEKFKSVANNMPYLKAIVTWACDAGDDIKRDDGSSIETVTFEQLLQIGREQSDDEIDERIARLRPNECCSLVYTSGTTGNPKAVMISHDNLVFESRVILEELMRSGVASAAEEERILSYLPLSHVAGMMVDIVAPLTLSAFTDGWCSANFARPYDLKRGSIGARLATVQPTLFLGVPRVWEKIMEKLKAVGAKSKGVQKELSTAAKARALEGQRNMQLGGSGKTTLAFPLTSLLDIVKGKLGLSKCKFAFTGAAPMTKECLEYFGSLNINVNEVYGMSECTGACTWSTDQAHTWGSVGYEFSGVEVKIFKVADDGTKTECPRSNTIYDATEEEQGEVCFRGRNIMMGYLANPRLGDDHMSTITKKNADAIDSEGWLHSGDKGVIDRRGMLKITGRYKELIIGAGGENVAPVPIEDNLKKLMPAVANVMMVGDKRKYNVALVTLKVEGATGELPGGSDLTGAALEVSPDSKTITEAMNDPKFIAYLQAGFDATNEDGAVVVSNAARIQKFTILPADFSVATGELTATLKLKRSVVANKYADAIDKLYSEKGTYINCFD